MKLDTTKLCRLGDREECLCIRECKRMSLILIKDGEIDFASNGRLEKDRIKDSYNEKTDTLLLAWPGEWSQNIFVLTFEDLLNHYSE